MRRTISPARIAFVLMVTTLAAPFPAATDVLENCVSEVSAHKRGQTLGPFPANRAKRFSMTGVTNCAGWTVEDSMSCGPGGLLADVEATSVAFVEESPDGAGCDLVVEEYSLIVKPIDPEHDPRFHGWPGE